MREVRREQKAARKAPRQLRIPYCTCKGHEHVDGTRFSNPVPDSSPATHCRRSPILPCLVHDGPRTWQFSGAAWPSHLSFDRDVDRG